MNKFEEESEAHFTSKVEVFEVLSNREQVVVYRRIAHNKNDYNRIAFVTHTHLRITRYTREFSTFIVKKLRHRELPRLGEPAGGEVPEEFRMSLQAFHTWHF